MKRVLLTMLLAASLAMSVGAGDKLRCSLTGKTIDSCCCEKAQNGKLHCTLANKDIETCCCKGLGHGTSR